MFLLDEKKKDFEQRQAKVKEEQKQIAEQKQYQEKAQSQANRADITRSVLAGNINYTPQYQKTPEFVRSNVDSQLNFASAIAQQKQAEEQARQRQAEIDREKSKTKLAPLVRNIFGETAGNIAKSIEDPFDALAGTVKSASTFGLTDIAKSIIAPNAYEAEKQLRQESPIASTVGTILGSLQPGTILEQGLVKAFPKLAGTGIVKSATRGATSGGTYGAIEGVTQGIADRQSIPQILTQSAERAGMYGIGGGVLGGAGTAIGQALSKRAATKTLNQSLQNIDNSYSKLASDGIAGYSGGTPIRKIVQAPLPKYYLSKPMGDKTFTYKPQMESVQGEIISSRKATVKPSVPTNSEIKALPSPVYKQPPVKPDMNITKRIATPKKTSNLSKYEGQVDKWYQKGNMSKDDIIKLRNELNNENGRIYSEQIDFLQSKQSKGNKPQQGGLVRDKEGNVINRTGRKSNNELWYQEFSKNTRTWDDVAKKWRYRQPLKSELQEIAEKQLTEGFGAVSGRIPANETYLNNKNMISAIDDYVSKIQKGEIKKLPESVRIIRRQKTGELKEYNKQLGEYKAQSAEVAQQLKTGRVPTKQVTKEMPLKATPGEITGYAKNVYEAGQPKKLPKIASDEVKIIRKTPTEIQVSKGGLRERLGLKEKAPSRVVEGEYIPPEGNIKTSTSKVKSSRELPELHRMTQAETDAYYGLDQKYSSANVKKLVEDTGAKVINKVGSSDIPTIIKHYQVKYNLPDVKISYRPNKSGRLGTTERINYDANGNPTGYRININPNQSLESKIGTIRHEIEHIIDLESGFKPSTQPKLSMKEKQALVNKPMREGYAQRQAGEHKNYKWFEVDYLRRASVKDALKAGQEVPESVLKEFPDLRNIKPSKTISEGVQAEIRPSETMGNTKSHSSEKTTFKTQTGTSEPSIGGIVGEGRVRERGFSTNEQTNINSDKTLQQNLASEKLNYMQLENKSTYARAKEIYDTGYENALQRFNSIDKYKPHDVPLAHMIANEAAKRGDMNTARNVISKIAEKLTEAGQFGQAARIMRRTDPATFYRYIQNNMQKLNEAGFERYGKKWKDLKLTPEVEREIFNLEIIDETSMNRIMNNVNRDLTEQMPTDAWEKWDTWRRMSMLLNPKTHIRNIVGNGFMMGLRKTSDTLAIPFEKAFVRQGERTKSFLWSKDENLVRKVADDWSNIKDDLMSNQKYGLETIGGLNQEKRIFKNNFLEAWNKRSSEWLNKEDEFFMGRAYRDALGQYMKANKLREITDIAREYASRRALESTFRQTNELANFIIKAKKVKYIGKAIDVAMPFTKTPLNIAKSAIDYSPAGLIKTLFDVRRSPQEAIETLTKGMVGSSLMGLGWYLGSMGWAKSNMEKSKKAIALTELTGDQTYSIVTPLGSYTFDWNQPSSLPLAMGVTLAENLSKNLDPDKEINLTKAIANSLASAGDSYFNMTVLRNIKNLLGGGFQGTTEALASLPADYIEQGIPTIVGQVSRSIDTKNREIYDENPLKMALNSAMNRTLLSVFLPEKVDVLGETKKQSSAWQQFISPGTGKLRSTDPLVMELDRLYETTKKTDFLPKVVEKSFTFDKKPIWLKPEEIETFQRRMGELNKAEMSKLIESSKYNRIKDDELKSKELKAIAENNYNIAKKEILEGRGIKTKYKKYVIPGQSLVSKK